MKALLYLYYLRMKGSVRNVFSKVGSAIFAIIMILGYGGLFVVMLNNGDSVLAMYNIQDANMAIFFGIGFTTFMVGVMLLQSKKSLFMENDAFYLFSGPFKRSQTMKFLMSQSVASALLCGAISLFMMVMVGSDLQYTVLFLVVVFFVHSLAYFFFTTVYYYVYLLSIKDKKYTYVSYYIVSFFVACIVAVYAAVLAQHDFSFTNSGMYFMNSDLFCYVPILGWIKFILVSYIASDWMLMGFGIALLLVSCGIVYYLMVSYKANFVEQAMQDAAEYTAKYKEMRAGSRSSMKDKKVRNVKSNIKEGAAAIWSKNMLMMKKSNSFLGFGDIVFIAIYLLVSVFGDLGFSFFVYMMMFWLFSTIQNSDMMKEMEYYHIYLIPDTPLKKLLYLIAPYLLKYIILVGVPIIVGGIFLQASILEMIQNYIMLAGYACLFISASVLATRVLKSRNNSIMENMLRMLIVLVSALPSIIVIIIIISLQLFSANMMSMVSIFSLIMNFVISGLIVYSCKSMMNGREIKSE